MRSVSTTTRRRRWRRHHENEESWAKSVTHLNVAEVPEGAVNLNLEGRRLTSPIQGFGKSGKRPTRVSMGGHGQEDRFWQATLTRLAAHFGHEGDVETHVTCVDGKRQSSHWINVWHSAAIRSTIYTAGTPGRALKRRLSRDRAVV
jgi:hypothetical protein